MRVTLSQDQVAALVADHLCEQSAGMLLDAKIDNLMVMDQAGRLFPLGALQVTLQAPRHPMPLPAEYRTPTGRVLRLATYEGERL